MWMGSAALKAAFGKLASARKAAKAAVTAGQAEGAGAVAAEEAAGEAEGEDIDELETLVEFAIPDNVATSLGCYSSDDEQEQ